MINPEEVQRVTEPLERVRLATEALADYQAASATVGQIRRQAVDYLRGQGMTLTDIATQAGVSRARLSQVGASRRSPERAILSDGAPVTIAVDTKEESKAPRPVVHQEHMAAYDILSKAAQGFGFDVNQPEYIHEPGVIDLNRSGLIVVCGPRRSPIIAQILAADERYGFEKDDRGWYLVDRSSGQQFRSPEDSGEPADYGYLGRLPRPDGRGYWLYMAGIHAPGGQGAAMYLNRELADLYQEVRNARWSCLIQCEWDPHSHEMVRAEQLAPVHVAGRSGARKPRD